MRDQRRAGRRHLANAVAEQHDDIALVELTLETLTSSVAVVPSARDSNGIGGSSNVSSPEERDDLTAMRQYAAVPPLCITYA